MVSVSEKLEEIHESDQSFEDFYRKIFDPHLQTGVWEVPGEYIPTIQAVADFSKARFLPEEEALELVSDVEERWRSTEASGTRLTQIDGNARIHWDQDGEHLLWGQLSYVPEDIDNNKKAEPGTLLFELRENYDDIASSHVTEYLEHEPLNENPDVGEHEGWVEPIFQIRVPADYDPDTYQETAEALATTATEIESMHKGIKALVRGYGLE